MDVTCVRKRESAKPITLTLGQQILHNELLVECSLLVFVSHGRHESRYLVDLGVRSVADLEEDTQDGEALVVRGRLGKRREALGIPVHEMQLRVGVG